MIQKSEKPSYKPHILLLILIGLMAGVIYLLYTNHATGDTPYECTNVAMGSYIQQTVYGKNAQKAATAAASAISTLESRISWRVEGSDIAKLNESAGEDWTTIDSSTMELLSQCLDVAQRSDGAFDPTVMPISSLWDFGGQNQKLPEPDQITKFLPYINYKNLRLDTGEGTASLKNTGEALDLGGAGKGAACDAAVAAYREAGADYGIVAAGGSIGVYGSKKDGSAWKIAVRDPMKTMEEQNSSGLGTIAVKSGFVSTSGSYEKYFEQDGKTYHHILNPKTGYPVENGLISVTVVADNGALSDILSTACFVLGREKSTALLEYYHAEAIFIDNNKNIFVSSTLQNSFVLEQSAQQEYTLCEWN